MKLVILLALWLFQNPATGLINASSSNCATANSCVSLPILPNQDAVSIVVVNWFQGNLVFEGAGADDVWTPIKAYRMDSTSPTTARMFTGTSYQGIWRVNAGGLVGVRVRAESMLSGAARVSLQPATATVIP